MIQPTPGRVVWFTPSKGQQASDFGYDDRDKPLAAIVTYVWNDRIVNLAVFDQNGNQHSKTSVGLLQDNDPRPENGHYCEWMPYQIGQAAKTQELEKKQV